MSLLGTSQQWKHRTGFPQQRPFHYTRTRYEAILRSRSALAPLAAEGAIAASNGHVSHFWNAIGYRAMSTAAEAPAAAAPVSQPGAAPAGGSAPPPPPPPPKKPNIFQRAGAMISAFNQRVQPAKWARRAFFLFILLRIADSQRRQKEFLTVKDGTLVRWRLDVGFQMRDDFI